jgi:glycosyltransferase involved in cell wall biosynthesis
VAFWPNRADHIRLSEGYDELLHPTVAPGAGDPRSIGRSPEGLGATAAPRRRPVLHRAPDRPLKILFCAWRDLANPLAGGSEVLIDRLASGLVEHGHDVSLLCAGPVGDREYRVVRSGGTYSQYLLAPLRYLAKFRDADIVVDVANGMSFYAPAWRRGPSVCFVNHVHTAQWGAWFPRPVAALARRAERDLMPFAYRHKLFVAVSPSTASALEKIGVERDRIRIVHNGVDPVASLLPKSPTPLFVALGRLVPHKRYDLLLRLWEQVRHHVGGKLVIAGDGPERERLRALAGEDVELVGPISEAEKARLLGSAWLFLHPSMLEGWGIVIMEAAAAGTPTLGFAVPGVRDSVVPGMSGMLAASEEEFVEQWVRLGGDAQARATLETGARSVARRYSWSQTVDDFLKVAEEAVGPARVKVPAPRPVHVSRVRHGAPAAGRPEVSVVVPAYNEGDRLGDSLGPLRSALKDLDHEIIVVDDGSKDDTVAVASRLLGSSERGAIVRLPHHRGKGAAVRAGVARASGEAVVFMDADLATDLSQLYETLAALDSHHIAIGSRSAEGSLTLGASAARIHMGRAFYRLARHVTDVPISDFQCGFKAFRASAAKLLFHLSRVDGFAFDVELLVLANKIGYRVAEIPVRWTDVEGGHVRPLRDGPRMALDVVRTRLQWTDARALAAVQASSDLDGDEAVAVLRSQLRGPDTVVPWRDGAMALLPFVGPQTAEKMAVRLQMQLPEFDVHASSVGARYLLGPSADELRSALAAS